MMENVEEPCLILLSVYTLQASAMKCQIIRPAKHHLSKKE